MQPWIMNGTHINGDVRFYEHWLYYSKETKQNVSPTQNTIEGKGFYLPLTWAHITTSIAPIVMAQP